MRSLVLLAVALAIGAISPTKAADPVAVAAAIATATENLRKWQAENYEGFKSWRPGTPVQFLNLSRDVVIFRAEGAEGCDTNTLQVGATGFCNTGPDNNEPFKVTFSLAGYQQYSSSELVVERGSVVVFVVFAGTVNMQTATIEDLEQMRARFSSGQ